MSSELTIVMYHYVRELERTRYPAIKGRRASEFRYQVEHFRRHLHPVTMAEIVHCVRTGDPLPPKAVLLTFDDGYLDHYNTCFPMLFDAGIQGAFFPPVTPVQDGVLLDVNRIHFLLAVADPSVLGREIDDAIFANRTEKDIQTPAEYRAVWAKPGRFDNEETIYVKRMLQVALPEMLRNAIAKDLFARYVSLDERAFASELYCTTDQLKVMQASGMYIGSHGATHYWLNAVDETTQGNEIECSLAFLRGIGSPVDDYWVMCYPYGSWDQSLLSILRRYQCTLGLTTEMAQARIGFHDPLLLPRLDTNDFPVR